MDMSNTQTHTFRPHIAIIKDAFGRDYEIRNGAEILWQTPSLKNAKEILMDLAAAASTDEAMAILYGGQEEAEADYLAEVASDRAFAEALERRAERGTWWG